MSESICELCGKPVSEHVDGVCPKTEAEKRGDRIGDRMGDRTINIKHEHKGLHAEPLTKAEREELESLKTIVTLQAQKEFDAEKESILDEFESEEKRKEIEEFIGEDPKKLEQIKASIILTKTVKPKTGRAPAGRAPILREGETTTTSGKDPMRAYVSDLYKKAKTDPNPDVRLQAERQIDALFREYEKGQQTPEAIATRRNLPLKGKRRMIEGFSVTQCFKCGSIISGRQADLYARRRIACPYCGYKGERQYE